MAVILVQEEPRGPSMLIELPVIQNGLNKVPFPDVDVLKNDTDQVVVIKSMRLITPQVLVGPIILNGVNAPITELQKMAMVLYSEGWEKGEYIPLLTLNDMEEPGQATPFRRHATRFADWKKVSWTKSFFQFANGQVSAGAPYVVLIDVEYQRFDSAGNELKGTAK